MRQGLRRKVILTGVMLAMLEGVKAAAGDLLFFLDGDDVWEEGKLAACTRAFDHDPSSCSIACCSRDNV